MELPVGWECCELGSISKIIMGQSPPGKSYNNERLGVPLLNGAADFNGKNIYPNCYTTQPTKISTKNDLLMCIRATIGNVTISDGEYCLGRGVSSISDIDVNRINLHYLKYYLETQVIKLANISKGSTIKGIKKVDLEKLIIPLPSLETQKKIVAILEKAEQTIQLQVQVDEHVDELIKSVFIDMFVKHPSTDSWDISTISEIALSKKGSMRTGPFGSKLKHSEFVEAGISVLGIDNVVNNKFQWDKRRYITKEKYEELKRYQVFPGDVLLTIMATIGRSCVVPDNIPSSINTKHLAAITLDQSKCLPEFLSKVFLHHPMILKQVVKSNRGAIMAGLNLTIIKKLQFPLPPIELQKQYVRIIKQISKLEKNHRKKNLLDSDLYNSLIQKAFRGELVT